MTDQPLLAELVGQHLAAHPHFLKGYAHGQQQERQRILELLEETSYCGSHNEIIAIIKGENE